MSDTAERDHAARGSRLTFESIYFEMIMSKIGIQLYGQAYRAMFVLICSLNYFLG